MGITTKYLWLSLLLPVLLRLLKSRSLPSRETLIKPEDERVLLLGASSGVGRDLAHAYAKRNARMYVHLSICAAWAPRRARRSPWVADE